MTNTMMMNDEALTFVAGGDNGDKDFEAQNKIQLYDIGDTVEVYSNFLHIFTNRGRIINTKRVTVQKLFGTQTYCEYLVKYEDSGLEWVTADDIERK